MGVDGVWMGVWLGVWTGVWMGVRFAEVGIGGARGAERCDRDVHAELHRRGEGKRMDSGGRGVRGSGVGGTFWCQQSRKPIWRCAC